MKLTHNAASATSDYETPWEYGEVGKQLAQSQVGQHKLDDPYESINDYAHLGDAATHAQENDYGVQDRPPLPPRNGRHPDLRRQVSEEPIYAEIDDVSIDRSQHTDVEFRGARTNRVPESRRQGMIIGGRGAQVAQKEFIPYAQRPPAPLPRKR